MPRLFCTAVAMLLALGLVGPVASAAAVASGGSVRATADRADDAPGLQIHVIYFVPADGADRRLDTDPRLHASFQDMRVWTEAQTDDLSWRFDTYKGTLDITYVRGQSGNNAYVSGGSPLGPISKELKSRGFDQDKTNKRYLVLYDGDTSSTGYCGVADYPVYGASTYTGQANGTRLGGAFAVVNTRSVASCRPLDYGSKGRPGFFPAVVLHELTHLEGLVPPGAPRTCRESATGAIGQHVCTLGPASIQDPDVALLDPESRDLMFPGAARPLHELSLDLGHDDYAGSSTATLNFEDSGFLNRPRNPQPNSLLRPIRLVTHVDEPLTAPHAH